MFSEGTNTLIVPDDRAASIDVKARTGELVKLGFSAHQTGINVWVLTHQLSSIAKSFRENVAAIVFFYKPSVKTTLPSLKNTLASLLKMTSSR